MISGRTKDDEKVAAIRRTESRDSTQQTQAIFIVHSSCGIDNHDPTGAPDS
ncbi:MAG: hypothetical protein WD904_11990 [Dehalococcoidia bacterium]